MNTPTLITAKLVFGSGARRRTWKKLASMTRHGQTLDEALLVLQKRSAGQRALIANVYGDMRMNMSSGMALNRALGTYTPVEENLLITSGQRSGNLSDGFLMAVSLLDARRKIRRATVSALASPLLLAVLCILLLYFVAFVFVPGLRQLSDPARWTGTARSLHEISVFLASPIGMSLFGGIVFMGIGVPLSMPFWTGKLRVWLDKYPPFSIYRMTVGSMWLFSVATQMRSGASVREVLDAMLNMNLTPWLHERVAATRDAYEGGTSLGEALLETGLGFPDQELVNDLCVYATLPGFDAQVFSVASEWLEDSLESIQNQAGIINVMGFIFIGAVLAYIVVGLNGIQNTLIPAVGV